ncbi:MAG TPA: serine/threonine-protein kinase [Solirubrobacteraceae bacterium]|nr:serine/threonine-protein kinase [Solirubrobacteraceae bacterium]
MRPSQARTARLSDDAATMRRAPPGPDAEPTAAPPGTLAAKPGQAPLVLERYRLQRRLGSGAFGTVWLATDERLERSVAVKILPRERVAGGRFEREARVAARLSHPGIVTLYEASVDDEGAYLVSELVRGRTLDALLRDGRLSDRDIVLIGLALCDALAHAHDEGVVHRDVKPSNVLVPARPATPAQCAKLTDFGVARVVGADTLTMAGDVIGTLAYMAPEQAEGMEVGAPADLYALAVVLYEALSGVNPVLLLPARSRRLGAHLPPLRRQRRDLPRSLGAGIDAALRPRPEHRGSVADLRAALAQALPEMSDEPGVVVAPLRAESEDPNALTSWGRAAQPGWPDRAAEPDAPRSRRALWRPEGIAAEPAADAAAEPRARPGWPARAVGAATAAAAAAWLSVHLLAPAPVPPAAAGLVAAALTLVLPSFGWLAVTVAAAAATAAQGHAGLAAVVAAAMLAPLLVLPLRPTAWPLGALAPGLGLIGAAGAWPALAALAGTAWRRAALGAAGWVWLVLLTPVAGRTLYVAPPAGALRAGAWSGSASAAGHHVFAPLATGGLLAPALVWALAATVLPLVVRGRSPVFDVVRAISWAVLTTLAVPAAILAAHGGQPAPVLHGAVLGAGAAAILALVPRWLAVGPAAQPTLRRIRRAGPRFP